MRRGCPREGALSFDPEPSDIGLRRNGDGAAVRLDPKRHSRAELTQLPSQALARIDGVRKQHLGQ